MKTAYYAHSMKKYNTPEEDKEIETIISLGFYPVNPKYLTWVGTMQTYFNCVDTCKALIASEYKDHVGKGVYDEIQYARAKGYLVYILRTNKLYKLRSLKLVDKNDWGVYYGKVSCGKISHMVVNELVRGEGV